MAETATRTPTRRALPVSFESARGFAIRHANDATKGGSCGSRKLHAVARIHARESIALVIQARASGPRRAIFDSSPKALR